MYKLRQGLEPPYFYTIIYIYSEKKEARGHAAAGVISVVKTIWLEECDREKKEVPVLRRHTGYDLLIPKGTLTISRTLLYGYFF